MMHILFPRHIADQIFGDGDLGTARGGEDLGDLVDVEVGAEGFLHFSLLGDGAGFFVYAGCVYGAGGAADAPGYAEVEEAPALDFAEVDLVEGEYHAGRALASLQKSVMGLENAYL